MGAPQHSTNPWARVRLVTGRSSSEAWEVRADTAGARIDVGASPRCAWQVEAPGVAPHHVEMYWDGEVLWVADLQGAGGVKVDGLPVDDWYATAQGLNIEFAGAQLAVETGGSPQETSGIASREDGRTEIARPAARQKASIEEARTEIAGPGMTPAPIGPVVTDRASLPEAKTMMLDRSAPPQPGPASMPRPAAPTPQPAPHGRAQAPRMPAPAPRMPPAPQMPARGAPQAPPMGQDVTRDLEMPPAGEDPNATRLVQAPSEQQPMGRPAMGRPPPPQIGSKGSVARASGPGVAPPGSSGGGLPAPTPRVHAPMPSPPAPVSAQPSSGVSSPGAAGTPGLSASGGSLPGAPGISVSGASGVSVSGISGVSVSGSAPVVTPGASGVSTPGGSGVGQTPGTMTASGARFAAPPPSESDKKKRKPGDKKEMTLPRRTWLLLTLTVAILASVLLLDEEEEVVQTEPQAAEAAEPGTAEGTAGQVPTEGSAGESTGGESAEVEEPQAELMVVRGPEAQAAEGEETQEIEEEEGDRTDAREAVDALMGGRQGEALDLYRRLAQRDPEVEAYAEMVRLLEVRVRADCRDGVDSAGRPCE